MRAIGVIRPNFLTLALFCGLLAWASVLVEGFHPAWWQVVLAVMGAILGHAAVNAFNEVSDFTSGLDLRTVRTPFPVDPALCLLTPMPFLLLGLSPG